MAVRAEAPSRSRPPPPACRRASYPVPRSMSGFRRPPARSAHAAYRYTVLFPRPSARTVRASTHHNGYRRNRRNRRNRHNRRTREEQPLRRQHRRLRVRPAGAMVSAALWRAVTSPESLDVGREQDEGSTQQRRGEERESESGGKRECGREGGGGGGAGASASASVREIRGC
jgi:hypothetical protein